MRPAIRVLFQSPDKPAISPSLTPFASAIGAARTAVSPQTIGRDARELLSLQFGDRAAGFDIKVLKNGQIILRGKVSSVEEKLSASRCLRGLFGCSSVVNCLTVSPVMQDGHTITLVTSDGRLTVHGMVSSTSESPDPSPSEGPAAQHASATPCVLPPPPTLTLPSGLPQARLTNTGGVRPASSMMYTAPNVTYVEQPTGYVTMAPTTVHPSPVQALPNYSTYAASTRGMQVAQRLRNTPRSGNA